MPSGDEEPRGSEGGHGLEILADVLGGPLQEFGVDAFTVIDITANAVVHVGPKGRNKGTAVSEWEGLRCELVDLDIEGDDPIVVHLQEHNHNCW